MSDPTPEEILKEYEELIKYYYPNIVNAEDLVKNYYPNIMSPEELDRLADIHGTSMGYDFAKSCDHYWVEYDSGWSKYEYCKHCDVKKDDSNE